MNTFHVILLVLALVSFIVGGALAAFGEPRARLALTAIALGLALWVFVSLLVAVGAH